MKLITIFSAALSLHVLFHLDCHAQSSNNSEPDVNNNRLEEIVVTSQKRSESLQDVPIAVTALTASELSAANIDGQLGLTKLTPNLSFTVVQTSAELYIRGIGSQFSLPGLESSVAVYFDDIYIPRSQSGMFDFNDVERIEVLKGPQGTLYGRNATGGAIRIITNDPESTFQSSGAVTTGSNNRLAVEAMINIPIIEGVSLRLDGRHDQDQGYVRNLAPGALRWLDGRNENDFHGKLLIEPNDDLKIKFSGDYTHKDDTAGNSFINLFPGLPEQIGAQGGVSKSFYTAYNDPGANGTPPLLSDVTSYGVAGRVDYKISGLTLSSITGYRYLSEYDTGDLDATGSFLQTATGLPLTKQVTQEVQATSAPNKPLTYIVGFFYLHEYTSYLLSVYGSSIGPDLALAGDGALNTNSYAPYLQADYAINDEFTLTAGARYTNESKTLDYNHGIIGALDLDTGLPGADSTVAPYGACSATITSLCESTPTRVSFQSVTPKVTLSYKAFRDALLYATYSRGFKSGGINLPSFGQVDTVKPETLDDYEIGLKYERNTFRFNSAAFFYNFRDIQVQVTDQKTGGTRAENAASAQVKGVESDLTWLPLPPLQLGLGAGYLNGDYQKFIGDAYIPCVNVPTNATCIGQKGLGLVLISQNLSGNQLENSPKLTAYGRAQYTRPLGGELGELAFGTIVNYRSKSYFDPAGRFDDPARTLLSANITWKPFHGNYYLAISGENLTGKEYNVVESPKRLVDGEYRRRLDRSSSNWDLRYDPIAWVGGSSGE